MYSRLLNLACTLMLMLNPVRAMGASSDESACDALGQALISTQEVTLETAPTLTHTDGLPAFCKVRGQSADNVGFEMRLPLEPAWNGRFLLAGCGGFCGQLLPDKPGYSNSINESLKRGYAAMAHDSGHQADSTASTDWARSGDQQTIDLWAHRVLPELVALGNSIMEAYYQREPARRYFSGCSNGGRLGLIAAQRYPDLFDGIAAGGPILDLSGNAGVQGAWMIQQAWGRDGRPRFTTAQIQRLQQHVLAQCDRNDGLEDGLIAAPDDCQPDLTGLACKNSDAEPCLDSKQLPRIQALYQGAHTDAGPLFPGLPAGSEHLWPFWITGDDGRPAWGALAAQGFLDIYREVPAGEHVNPADIQVVEEAAAMAATSVAVLANATETDMSALRAAGGKLLLWHGWADPLILPQRTVSYFEDAMQENGGADVLREHARLFMVPGHGHCWEAPGLAPDLFDPLQILEAWVEQDIPPDHIIARDRLDPSEATATARLCPYPQRSIHEAQGSTASAAGYRCTE